MPGTKTKTAQEQAAKTTQETTASALEDFSWDDGTENFFGIEDTAVEKKAVVEDGEEEEEEGFEEEEEEDENFFGEGSEEEEEEGAEEESIKSLDKGDYKSLLTKMKEKGILHNMDLPEEEVTEDKFIELQDLEIESRVDEAFEGFFSELDEDAAAFLKFKKDGGNTQEFFKVYRKSGTAPTGDLDDEAYQEKISRYYYEQIEGDDPEDIDDKIEWLKDSGKLSKFSQKFDGKVKQEEKKQKEDLQKQAQAADKAALDSRKAFVDSVQETLENTDKVDNFTFTTEGKKSLLPFITKQTVKVGKNKYITPMQDKLQTALRSPEKMLVLAQLLENDFDISSVVNSATTGKTKKLKTDIQRQKSAKPTSSGRTGKKRSLADIDF